ncbi:MAG: uncharacterized protein KVP18_005033 [Porospora cf. gigantea A]|uniref:uncharacterized protein n=1 Tax=Porospora cf. gigantea A TaxID=2853593 RepID=UPI00355A52C3|nr:MAG: hypothetical protein KVP18_005033 [Porospora cf. gigantea A]
MTSEIPPHILKYIQSAIQLCGVVVFMDSTSKRDIQILGALARLESVAAVMVNSRLDAVLLFGGLRQLTGASEGPFVFSDKSFVGEWSALLKAVKRGDLQEFLHPPEGWSRERQLWNEVRKFASSRRLM